MFTGKEFPCKDATFSPCYIGLNKNEPALVEKVNAIIAEAKTDGSLNAIAQKWLGDDIPSDL